MNSTLIFIGLSIWMSFVAAGFVWFAWGIAQSVGNRIRSSLAARRAARAQASVAPKQESPS